ncbi:hypothetical protein DRQ36_11120 [bacterium]|nr:MAG: hypothetical protein DRQ36_11120 [bacterium]
MDIDVNRLNRIMTEAGKYSGKEVILQVFGNPIPGCRLAEFAECRFDTESYPYMRLTLNRVSKDGKLHFLTMCHSINICGQEYAIVIEETERTAEASRFQFFLYFCDEIKYNATRVVPSDTRLRVFKLSRDIRDYFLAQKRDLEEAAIFLDERVLLLPELT